ncbi:alpha/beta fold hydrolase [Amycolatopsis acidiphila]|uniref:Thioesterase n=1 Tax=Amycolatopsis acidiphila TaxID=715473 RepID=A0A557ZX74_9PSEU|nr:alpha/beta fold hydrolase [Amycolatopsis acidiphila]TVT16600.1 thioesterase [Amycolatopsis acidiphila]UIJ62048.1 alpha/beta fold hydrolase [Amycolatopsis acidiphila]GHG98963.1 oleoyl-ACP hydrolase [Amycolatopsis acidiphila]
MSELPELVPDKPYLWRARSERATHKLICFPHAGAGAGTYYEWAERLPAEIELLAVQLPGRQERITEDLITEVPALVAAVVDGIAPDVTANCSFFGHSAGALLAFEVTRALEAAGLPAPGTLFVSGQPAPGGWKAPPVNGLPEDRFRDALTELGGMDAEVFADDEIMAMVIPVVRAEFRMWEEYEVDSAARVSSSIVALTGDADSRSPVSAAAGWRSRTSGAFETKVYPGGHFYHFDHLDEVVAFVAERVLAGTGHGVRHG